MEEHKEQSELFELRTRINKALAEAHNKIANDIKTCDEAYVSGEESMLELFEKVLLH